MALPPSTPLEETDSDLMVKLEREKLKDSDERMQEREDKAEGEEEGEEVRTKAEALKEKSGGEDTTDGKKEEFVVKDGERVEQKETDPVVLASRCPREMDERIGEMEKTYGVLMLEKALGLLTAILPQDMTVSTLQSSWDEGHMMCHMISNLVHTAVTMDTTQT